MEEPLEFATLLSGITHSNITKQLESLQTLLWLASDETAKTALGQLGALPRLADVLTATLDRSITEDSASPQPTRIQLATVAELSAHTIWALCLAHTANKKLARNALEPLLRVLSATPHTSCQATPSNHNLRRLCAFAVWSICYGVVPNQERVLELHGVEILVKVLRNTEAEHISTRRAVVGALWHVSSLQSARELILQEGALPALVDMALLSSQSPPPSGSSSEDSDFGDSPDDAALMACLTLANLALSPTHTKQVGDAGGLAAIENFVTSHDVAKFRAPLVWTTMEPLVVLLQAAPLPPQPPGAVALLGLFLVANMCVGPESHRTGGASLLSKLFMEGGIEPLQRIASLGNIPNSPPTALLATAMARMTLRHLGLELPTAAESTTKEQTCTGTMADWLRSMGLEEYTSQFAAAAVTFEVLPLLSEEDLKSMNLPLGARRKFLHAAAAIGRATAPQISQNIDSQRRDCLICCDAPRTTCFVPCGHVATCEACAKVLRARGDRCIVCRSPIKELVVPFYV